MRHAMRRADEFGVGACLAANMTHWGRAHAYAYRAAQEGMIGICMTNATPNMLAPGASRPILANNPMAIGVPRGPDQDPVVFDFAMSQAAVGKVDTCRREGQNAPLGWGLDASGQPTSDPGAILASGNILPTGGHKGAGLAIMIELLTGALAGGAFSFEAIQLDAGGTERHSSKLFLALNIDALGERATFQERVAALIDYLRDSADPGQEVLYPGERGYRARDRHLAEGIPLEPQTVAELRTIGMKLDERG
jgi:LDH2 family malate/lactate/ureidoglycolate dehydrogenase